jgi:hypothetical protein
LHDFDFARSKESLQRFEANETFSKVVRPYASLTTNCVDFSLDDNLAVFSDPINIKKSLPSLLAFPVDIDRADMFLDHIQQNNRL